MSRVLLIGAGVIARTHAAAARALPGGAWELHVSDPSAQALESFIKDFPEAVTHPTVEGLLALPPQKDDVVIVATPPSSHHPLVMAALGSGRHVLCEKPLAMTPDLAQDMAGEAARRGLLLHDCSSRFLRSRANSAAKALAMGGELGEVYRVRWIHLKNRGRAGIEYQPGSRWFLQKSVSGGGIGVDWTVYDLATLLHVLEPVSMRIVSAFTRAPETGVELPAGAVYDVEHHLGAEWVAELASGAKVSIAYERGSCCHGVERSEAEISGTRGAVAWDWLGFSGERAWWEHRRDHQGKLMTERHEYPNAEELPIHHRPLHGLVAALRGETTPVVDGSRAASILEMIHALYQTAVDGAPRTVTLRRKG